MNKLSAYDRELNKKIFDTLDNWMHENHIKNDADILKRINKMFPDHSIEQGRFSLLRNCNARIKLDEVITIAESIGISIDKLLQRENKSTINEDYTAADVLKLIFKLHNMTNVFFEKHREYNKDGSYKDFTGIFFGQSIIVTKAGNTILEYFINDVIDNLDKLEESILNLSIEDKGNIIQKWENGELEIAKDISASGGMYNADLITGKYT